MQYGNAFLQGMQAAALKPADFFGNDDILYLMEDMATGEIRLSILWEWVHKGAVITADDPETNVTAGAVFDASLFERLLAEEFEKLLRADDKDVHENSKTSTLPISRHIAFRYVLDTIKAPWFIDLLNINLNNNNLTVARERIDSYLAKFKNSGERITENLDFPLPS
jgi:malate synthase